MKVKTLGPFITKAHRVISKGAGEIINMALEDYKEVNDLVIVIEEDKKKVKKKKKIITDYVAPKASHDDASDVTYETKEVE